MRIRSLKEAGALADVVAKYSTWDVADKQQVLEEADAGKRLELVYGLLSRDLDRFDTEKQISARVKQQMDANQREYYLREQMKAIQKELGGGEETLSEIEDLKQRVRTRRCPKKPRNAPLKRSNGSRRCLAAPPEATVVRTYLDTLLDLPWSEADDEHLDIAHTEKILNDDHYALEEPKERILEFLAVRQLTKDIKDNDTARRSSASSGLPASVRRASASPSRARSTAPSCG